MNIADLSEIVEVHGKAIYGFCYNLTKNISETDDLYQETFLKATEMCHKIDKNNNPKSFLISIAIGLWRNKRRKYAWRQKIVQMDEFDDNLDNNPVLKENLTTEDIVITNERNKLLQEAADQLNDKLKIPLYMYYTAGIPVEDIALALKIPSGTVKSRLFKARKLLKKIMEDYEYEKF